MQNIQESLKSHNNHVVSGISKINDAVQTANKENKDLAKSIAAISDECHQQRDSSKSKELIDKLENVVMLLQVNKYNISFK